MPFSDFVEKVAGVPICSELKQGLDKWYELYKKDPENISVLYPRGSGLTMYRSFMCSLVGLYKEDKE